MKNDMVRIMIVDDHKVVRSGIGAFLQVFDDFELVGEASNGQEAIEKCEKLKPDVILMDLVMPEMDGAQATRVIKKKYPGIQVIILTSYKEDNLVEEALKAGAIGYLLKNVSAEELSSAIKQAHSGKPVLAPEAAQALIKAAQRMDNPAEELTPREKDVLRMMKEGLTNPEIAEKLIISRSTVKFHVSSILSKLGVSSRTEAVSHAIENKII